MKKLLTLSIAILAIVAKAQWPTTNIPPAYCSVKWQTNTVVTAPITNYTVFWGTNVGSFTFNQNVGLSTNYTITNMLQGVTYYIAVQATDTNGLLSPLSNILPFTPFTIPSAPGPLQYSGFGYGNPNGW